MHTAVCWGGKPASASCFYHSGAWSKVTWPPRYGTKTCRAVTVRHSILCQHLLVLHPAIGSCRLLNTETLGGGDYLFAFRMFMVLFRRELSFGDSLYLWEVNVTSWHVTLNLEHSMHLPIWGVIFELGPLAFIVVLWLSRNEKSLLS
jgi:hypothetical protein